MCDEVKKRYHEVFWKNDKRLFLHDRIFAQKRNKNRPLDSRDIMLEMAFFHNNKEKFL